MRTQLAAFRERLGRSSRQVPDAAASTLSAQAFRRKRRRWTSCAPAPACWPIGTRMSTTTATTANVRKAERLLAQLPVVMAARHRLKQGKEPVAADPQLSLAGKLSVDAVPSASRRPAARQGDGRLADPVRRARIQRLDVHRPRGRARRCPICTRRSSAAIGALKGPLHGGANERVMEVLRGSRHRRQAEALDSRRPGPQSNGSWASATAFTKTATRGPRT